MFLRINDGKIFKSEVGRQTIQLLFYIKAVQTLTPTKINGTVSRSKMFPSHHSYIGSLTVFGRHIDIVSH